MNRIHQPIRIPSRRDRPAARRFSFRLLLGLALLLPAAARAQDAEVARLVGRLGDDDYDAREEATRRLERIGPLALPALREARDGDDAETAMRARDLVERIERESALRERTTRERTRKLRLVMLDVSDAPLGRVLEQIAAQTGLRLDPGGVDPSRRVTLRAERLPCIEALDRLGVGYDREQEQGHHRLLRRLGVWVEGDDAKPYPLAPAGPPPGAIYTEGARFAFAAGRWAPREETLGVVFRTACTPDALGCGLEWDVAVTRRGRDARIETCGVHSPGVVYVPEPGLSGATLTVRGKRQWTCDIPVTFSLRDGANPQRVGAFELWIDGPRLLVRSDAPVREEVLQETVTPADVRIPAIGGGIWRPDLGGQQNVVPLPQKRTPKRTWVKEEEPAWCGCPGRPAPANAPPAPPQVREHILDLQNAFAAAGGAAETITVLFHLPLEETFTLESGPLP